MNAIRITGLSRDRSVIHISEPERQAEIPYADFCLKNIEDGVH